MANIPHIKASTLANLLSSSSRQGDMHVRIASENSLVLSSSSFQPRFLINFSTETIEPFDPEEPGRAGGDAKTSLALKKGVRRSGNYWFELDGERTECISLKELLFKGLQALESYQDGTLEQLSRIKPRTRRIVARDPKSLFDRQHLADDYAEKLMDGWWFGTNNSADETKTWFKRACQCAGLKWGKNFKVSL